MKILSLLTILLCAAAEVAQQIPAYPANSQTALNGVYGHSLVRSVAPYISTEFAVIPSANWKIVNHDSYPCSYFQLMITHELGLKLDQLSTLTLILGETDAIKEVPVATFITCVKVTIAEALSRNSKLIVLLTLSTAVGPNPCCNVPADTNSYTAAYNQAMLAIPTSQNPLTGKQFAPGQIVLVNWHTPFVDTNGDGLTTLLGGSQQDFNEYGSRLALGLVRDQLYSVINGLVP